MKQLDQLMYDLQNQPATVNEDDYRKCGYHLEVELGLDQVRGFATLLRDLEFYLVFVSAVHTTPDIRIVYQFAAFDRPCRIIGRAPVAADGTIPTISDIFDGANWH